MENYTALIGLITTVIGAGIGYYLKYFLDKQKELTSEVTKERRAMYQQFVDLVMNLIYSVKKDQSDQQKYINNLQEFFKKNVVYASPRVVKALSKMFQLLYSESGQDPKEVLLHMTFVIKEMRADLGLSNKGLGKHGEELIKPMFKDWEAIMK